MVKKSQLVPYMLKIPKIQENIVSYIKKITNKNYIYKPSRLTTYTFDQSYIFDINYNFSYYQMTNFFNFEDYKKEFKYLELSNNNNALLSFKNLNNYLILKRKYSCYDKVKKKVNNCL